MILITGGYPLSGKSEFAIKLRSSISLIIHINPKDLLPDNFSEMDNRTQSVWMTSAWELSYEKTTEFVKKAPNKAIAIFDTAASKYLTMKPLLDFAKEKGHSIIYAFVHASKEERSTRTKNWGMYEKLEAGYTVDFKHTIPSIKKNADQFFLIKNNNGETGYRAMTAGADAIAKYIESVREHNHGPKD